MKYINHTPGPWKEFEGFIVGGPWADGEIHYICDPRCAPPDADNMRMMDANARLIAAGPDLLFACKCALADLEGIMPEFEPSGDREHPAWETIKLLKKVIK